MINITYFTSQNTLCTSSFPFKVMAATAFSQHALAKGRAHLEQTTDPPQPESDTFTLTFTAQGALEGSVSVSSHGPQSGFINWQLWNCLLCDCCCEGVQMWMKYKYKEVSQYNIFPENTLVILFPF